MGIDRGGTDDSSLVTASWNREVLRYGWLTATSLYDVEERGATFSLSFSIPLGSGIDSNTTMRHATKDRGWSLRQTVADLPEEDQGFGWRMDGEVRNHSYRRMEASALWDGSSFNATADLSVSNEFNAARAGISGSLVAIAGGGIFPADRIDDAFAVVDTDGVAGVKVWRENRYLGTTDSDGLLLVDNLGSWNRNLLAVDPLDFPLQKDLDDPAQIVVPRGQSGTVVSFRADRVSRHLVRLVLPDGGFVPLGATVSGPAGEAVTGYDGQAWVGGLEEGVVLTAIWKQGRCSARIDSVPAEKTTEGGTFQCVPDGP
ncbi:MAG: fimbria/pilus outer membrane usher protein [Pseudomonadota bacterium]|nr:fimbria/pilus outer membrane usher protein [Pseudomonadota bacterium]